MKMNFRIIFITLQSIIIVMPSLINCFALNITSAKLDISHNNQYEIFQSSNEITITTIAGTGNAGFSGDGGLGIHAQLNNPSDVAFYPDGSLLIADTDNHRIRQVNLSTGIITTIAGNGINAATGNLYLASEASIALPKAIAIDDEGNVYVTTLYQVRVIHNVGIIDLFAGSVLGDEGNGIPARMGKFGSLEGIAIDQDGGILIADTSNHKIRKIRADDGIVITIAGNGNPGGSGDFGLSTFAELNNPIDLAISSSGIMYIAEKSGNRIRQISDGIISTFYDNSIDSSFPKPIGLALSNDEFLYVGGEDNYIRCISLDSVISTIVSENGSQRIKDDDESANVARFNYPSGMTVDPKGNLYIADTLNHRIQKISFPTKIITPTPIIMPSPTPTPLSKNINTSENFPDPNFRAVVEKYLEVKPGGVFTAEEAASRTGWLNCRNKNITNVKGIEFFSRLTEFLCSGNLLTNIDISRNTNLTKLECRNNQLQYLDVSYLKFLRILECSGNQLTDLNISKNSALVELNCNANQLTKLDVSQNPALESLHCGSNQLSNLDVTKNTILSNLYCSVNQLKILDVSKNYVLESLNCHSNQITSLDVSQNHSLKYLECLNNQLTNLDVSYNTQIISLNCNWNQINTLDVSKNLALKHLECGSNQLLNLNVSKNTDLIELYCQSNKISTLDVSQNPFLKTFWCKFNQLTQLNVSKNLVLEDFWCNANQITSLDISNNLNLNRLYCNNNRISDISSFVVNTGLEADDEIDIRFNDLDYGDWENFLILLQRVGEAEYYENVTSFIKKGLAYSPQNDFDPYQFSNLSGDIDGDGQLTIDDIEGIISLFINDKDLTEFQLRIGDVNQDGFITPQDAQDIYLKLFSPSNITIEIPGLPEEATRLEMIWIKPGTFIMGSENEYYGYPRHKVTLNKGFYIGKYEVTQAQWEAVMGVNPSRFNGKPNNPVERVSWFDCQEFIQKLNQTGHGLYRLPSEAEWEYACRAGTSTRYYWGEDPGNKLIDDYAWHGANSDNETKKVGLKLPNNWGLYDMAGNVYEWCEDDWHDDYNGAPLDGSAWIDSPRNSSRVFRGGHWGYMPEDCLSAIRLNDPPEDKFYPICGFRLVRNFSSTYLKSHTN